MSQKKAQSAITMFPFLKNQRIRITFGRDASWGIEGKVEGMLKNGQGKPERLHLTDYKFPSGRHGPSFEVHLTQIDEIEILDTVN